MKIVFFGTPDFAAAILEHIVTKSSHTVVAVVSKPDAPSGRHQILKDTPVKAMTKKLLPTVPILQMPKASSKECVEQLKKIQADVYWVVAYGEIIGTTVLEIPKCGCFNVHASLLPQYRGAAPIQRCLIDGCTKTGISIFRLTKGMDSGDIIWKKACSVEENTDAGELTERLLSIAKEGTIACLEMLASSCVTYTPQFHEEATLAPKIEPDDRILNPSADILDIHNRVRALSPNPGSYFSIIYKGTSMRLKILKTHIVESDRVPMRRFAQLPNKMLGLRTPEGTLVFDFVQLQGKSEMPSDQFLRGLPLSEILIT